jgi:hypothetical protein
VDFITSDGHVVVQNPKTGLYYDSEHCNGNKTLGRFCGMTGFYSYKIKIDRQIMTWYWACNGWEKRLFRKIIQKIDPEDYVVTNKDRLTDFVDTVSEVHGLIYSFKIKESTPSVISA